MKSMFAALVLVLAGTLGVELAAKPVPPHLPGGYILVLKSFPTKGAYIMPVLTPVLTPVGNFKNWDRCKSAGLEVQARLASDDTAIDFVCVPVGS